MNEEIMNNEVIEETIGDVATATPVKGLKIAAVVGAAALVGVGAYKLGKHLYAKIKARRAEKKLKDVENVDYTEIVDAGSEDAE